MKTLKQMTLLFFSFFTLQGLAQNFKIPEGYQAMKMLSPYDVFSGKLQFSEIPELAAFCTVF